MVILVDTREQKPLLFDSELVTEVRQETLSVGDYGCEFKDGTRPPCYFERKSLADLWGSMTQGHKRFKRLLLRASSQQVRLILLVEASLSKVAKGFERSDFQGEAMVKKLFTLWVKYNLGLVFAANREEAARHIVETYSAIGRNFVSRSTLGENKNPPGKPIEPEGHRRTETWSGSFGFTSDAVGEMT